MPIEELWYNTMGSPDFGEKSMLVCLAQWFRGWEFDSLLCVLGEETACVAPDKLHSPRMSPEEGNGKSLLSTLYLDNPGKGHHKSELT